MSCLLPEVVVLVALLSLAVQVAPPAVAPQRRLLWRAPHCWPCRGLERATQGPRVPSKGMVLGAGPWKWMPLARWPLLVFACGAQVGAVTWQVCQRVAFLMR